MSTCPQWQWNTLPSEILFKILSYLSHKDRLSVCSTCSLWRSALFYPKFWKKVILIYNSSNPECNARSIFIANNTVKYVRSCTIYFDSVSKSCLLQVYNVLSSLKYNQQIEEIILLPTNCHTVFKSIHPCHLELVNNIEYLNNNEILNENEIVGTTKRQNIHQYSYQFNESAYECLQDIINSSRSLQTLVLGCLQGLTDMADDILPLLEKHSYTLTTLGIASVKHDPNSYPILHITPSQFMPFTKLQILTVDYDYVNDHFLGVFTRSCNTPLSKLVINIHGIEASHLGTTDLAWHKFISQNPQCSLALNLIQSFEGVEQLHTGLLRPSMPVTTFRALFCEWINIQGLRLLSDWYSESLQDLQLVDALDHRSWGVLQDRREDIYSPDPLVMLAWKCKRLKRLTLIGYSYNGNDLIAIARLRGDSGLQELIFPEDCFNVEYPIKGLDVEAVIQDVSIGLGRPWRPMKSSQLHESLQSIYTADSVDEYILPFLLKDSLPSSQ